VPLSRLSDRVGACDRFVCHQILCDNPTYWFFLHRRCPQLSLHIKMANTDEIRANGYVGFDTITQQIEHKLLKRGFQFNVIVVGELVVTFC
jgi:hypothetical protein